MDIEQQRCPQCDSAELHNLVLPHAERPPTVYVRCAQCGAMVARFQVQGFFQPGQGIEQYLSTNRGGEADSGRRWLAELQTLEKEATEGFEAAVENLRRNAEEAEKK